MPKKIAPLSDRQCRDLRYDAKVPRKNVLRDGDGLLLVALPSGRKSWRLRYRNPEGRDHTAAHRFGYPELSLADAREWRREMRALLAQGIDPLRQRADQEEEEAANENHRFDRVCEAWIAYNTPDWAPATLERNNSLTRNVLLPTLANKQVAELEWHDVLAACLTYETIGRRSSAHKAKSLAVQILDYAVVHLRIRPDNPARLIPKGGLKPNNEKPFPHLTDPERIGALLRDIDGYQGTVTVRNALRLLPLVFVRPSELRMATWGDIDLDGGQWVIPAELTKMRRAHVVPLSRQALGILRDQSPMRKSNEPTAYVFPVGSIRRNPDGSRKPPQPISEAAFNAGIRRLGYATGQQTGHGFRHIASTHLHECGEFRSEVIEAQLGHKDRNQIRATYNQAQYLDERRRLMQYWADYLDELRLQQSSR